MGFLSKLGKKGWLGIGGKAFFGEEMDFSPHIMRANAQYQNYLAQAQAQQEAILPFLEKQFGEARGLQERAFSGARQTVLDDYGKNLASTQENLTKRGLGNTVLQESAKRGAQRQKQRALTSVNAQESGALSGLLQQEAEARAGAMGNLSEFIAQRGGTERGMQQGLIDYWMAQQQNKQQQQAQLLGTIGSVAGFAMGGPAGGMFGGQLGSSLGGGYGY